MAKNKYDNEPIARGNVYAQAYNQMNNVTGPVQTTADNLQNMSLVQNYKRNQNPVVQDTGGAMTQGANGISAGSGGNVMTQQPDNTSWTRSKLQGMGINDIGWNAQTGAVTLGGKDYLTPEYVSDEGKSYDTNQNIFKAAKQYFKDTGNPVEGVDAYVAQNLGVKNAVTWSDGNLMIGGQLVPTVYVDDSGTAYAHQADIDKAITALRDSAGLKTNRDIVDDWNDKYGSRINRALNSLMNRKEWSYDPETDPAYQSYRDQYIREGNRAYQDAYADMAANTGGYGSSAAMNAAGQQWNYYMQQLGDRIPELQQNDYNRYLGEYQLRQNALDSLRTVANDDYNKEYQANRDIISDINAANEASYNRRVDARNYNRDVLESDREYPYREKLLQDQVTQSAEDTARYGTLADLNIDRQRLSNQSLSEQIRSQELENWNTNFQKILTSLSYDPNGDRQLSEREALELGIYQREDGSYPTVREMQKSFATLQAVLENTMWTESQRQQLIDTWKINNGVYGI